MKDRMILYIGSFLAIFIGAPLLGNSIYQQWFSSFDFRVQGLITLILMAILALIVADAMGRAGR